MDVEDYISKDLQNFMWSFLGPDDLCSVSQVCKIFHETSKKDIHWQKFIHPYYHKDATEIGFKKYFIQKMREYSKKSIEQKKRPTWLFNQLLHPKNPNKEIYLNKYPFLSEVDVLKDENSQPNLIRMLLCGDSGVGKTKIFERYYDAKFTNAYVSTIGVDFKAREKEIMNEKTKVQVWDTAGQERFQTITNAYLRGATAVIIVFDLSDRISFRSCTSWMDKIKKSAPKEVFVFLCGAKCDLEQKVDQEEIDKFCQEHNLPYFKTSAKEDIGIGETIEYVAERCIIKLMKNPLGVVLPSMVFNLQPVLNIDEFMKHFVPQKKDSTCVIQ